MSTEFFGRTSARSQALQLLFQAEANGRTVAEVLDGNEYALSDGPLDDYGRELALGADAMRHDIDLVIAQRSNAWNVNRMPATDRNLMRLAIYEMLCEDEVDIAVCIDEAVELAKAYGGSDETSRFVNGLLGRVADDIEAGKDVIFEARAARYGHKDEAEPEPEVAADSEAEPVAEEPEAREPEPAADDADLPSWVTD